MSVLPIFQFHLLTTFTIHGNFLDIYKSLTYRRPPWKHWGLRTTLKTICPCGYMGSRNSQVLFIYIYYIYIIYIIYIYIHIYMQSPQIFQKQDGYNTYVIIPRLSLIWLCGNWNTWAHDVYDAQSASSLYVKTCWQSPVICVHAGVILGIEGSIWQSSIVNKCYFIAILTWK